MLEPFRGDLRDGIIFMRLASRNASKLHWVTVTK
jgi:hypothetical protein